MEHGPAMGKIVYLQDAQAILRQGIAGIFPAKVQISYGISDERPIFV
jgi:hypothetical protein